MLIDLPPFATESKLRTEPQRVPSLFWRLHETATGTELNSL